MSEEKKAVLLNVMEASNQMGQIVIKALLNQGHSLGKWVIKN